MLRHTALFETLVGLEKEKGLGSLSTTVSTAVLHGTTLCEAPID